MAERMLVAFGRYLRMLRERRGYSLDDIASLTKPSPDTVSKAYLSRVENGHTRIGFSKMISLARALDVPLEAVAERLSLDLELDKLGAPETEGKSFEELVWAGGAAIKKGKRWEAYAYSRDALSRVAGAPLMKQFRDAAEQRACSIMNLSTVAGALGKWTYALHELRHVEALDAFGAELKSVFLTRMSVALESLGQVPAAVEAADRAIEIAESIAPNSYLGYAYHRRAMLHDDVGEKADAVRLNKKAYRAFSDAGRTPECSNTLLNLANLHYRQERLRSARRAVQAAERLAIRAGDDLVRARNRILLGEIESREGKGEKAARLWRDAAEMARKLPDRVTQFRSLFRLYVQAVEHGDTQTESAFRKRLSRILPWIPSHLDEVRDFAELSESRSVRGPSKKQLAKQQHRPASRTNPDRPLALP